MADDFRVALEVGPKGKRVVAVARDWPGLSRGAKSEEAAIDQVFAYRARYRAVAALAGLEAGLMESTDVTVVERYPGVGGTDFWGISFAFSDFDRAAMSSVELERELALMQASWAFFDDVRSRVSAELKRGPRGGGRDRDVIVVHVLGNERDWAQKIDVMTPEGVLLTDVGLKTHRAAYCAGIRAFHAEGKMARNWPLRYLMRHTAFHTLDHAWEMEDKNLGNVQDE